MKTPDFEGTFKGIVGWLAWKILHLIYVGCTALPMALYVACLLVVAIERRSTIELPIIMTVMLHPSVSIPLGVCIEFIGQQLSASVYKNHKNKGKLLILRRFITYSLNVHLATIAALLYCLYSVWISLEVTSTMNFENKPFDQCKCDPLNPCINDETENSFQNVFVGISIQPFILAFLVVSLACHIAHSVILAFPPPLSMSHFILGQDEDQDVNNSITNTISKMLKNHARIGILGLSVVALLTGIVTSPYILFDTHFSNGDYSFKISTNFSTYVTRLFFGSDSTCQTIDNFNCTFPFKYEGSTFWTCSDSIKDGVSPWCATDADTNGTFKSIGECKPNCQKSKQCKNVTTLVDL